MGRLPVLKRITHVKFNASWVDKGSYGLIKARDVEFGLGLGPCGRVVTHLAVEITADHLKVIQTSRLPEDVAPPAVDRTIKERLDADRRHRRVYPGMKTIEVTTGFLWWKKTEEVAYPTLIEPKGLLTDAERDELNAAFEAQGKAYDAWYKAFEIKEFVYKMQDVHGRIVTTS
ncbi:hypothetical protein Kurepalu2_00008 [Pseudomonas phage vB_PpuP-Kurepalu-2]